MTSLALDEVEIISALNRVDWNFPRATTLQNTIHSLHWFPGNFIPQIPSYLIKLLSRAGDWVLDPFCGSGTTGIEALALGRRAWQVDINRSSIMISEGKHSAITSPYIWEDLSKIAQDFYFDLSRQSSAEGANREGTNPELNRWFHQDTLGQLRFIWQIIESSQNQQIRNVLEMLFSDTLFACASTLRASTSGGRKRRHHWGWIADNVVPKKTVWHDAVRLFRERLIHTCDVLLSSKPISCLESIIQRQDIRSLDVPDGSIDLVVTSPPYLGMIDYALSNRLTYLWFGWPLLEDLKSEIGARQRRNRLNVIGEYLQAMACSCEQISRVMRPGAYCAIVIGASRKHPELAKAVIDLFGSHLRLVWGPVERVPTRRRVSEKGGTEPIESVCLFGK
jgi:hypothetical protein